MNREEFLNLLKDEIGKGERRPMRKCEKHGQIALYELKILRCWQCERYEKCHPLEAKF